jgi:hypothetical protein
LAVVEAQTVVLIDAAIGDPLERGGSSRRARRAARRATLFALMTLTIVIPLVLIALVEARGRRTLIPAGAPRTGATSVKRQR